MSSESSRRVLIVGASGLIGTAAVEEFTAHGWDVATLSRRKPPFVSDAGFTHFSVDLDDRAAVDELVTTSLGDVTHIVYTAVYEKPGLVAGWRDPEQMAKNRRMLMNLVDPLAARGGLQHVSIMQGTKAYGVHIHPIPVPARERFERDDHENFYWLQEDYLKEASERSGFTWTIFRPTVVMGPNVGVAMNVLPIVGIYAAIAHETGRPFGFPGTIPYPREAVDVQLIAEATRWAATEPSAANQHFNLTNGEVFSWKDLWPDFAESLGVELGEAEPLSMAEELPRHEDLWRSIADRHGLREGLLSSILGESHHYADFCFGYGRTEPPAPMFVSTVKIKEAGFSRVFDTSERTRYWVDFLVEKKILPRF
ncbi:MAG TPA: SDR family oxidoreductase [Brevibacterium sp.]|nr:SDR family oxidoreductase [Brevibacterium sp.]